MDKLKNYPLLAPKGGNCKALALHAKAIDLGIEVLPISHDCIALAEHPISLAHIRRDQLRSRLNLIKSNEVTLTPQDALNYLPNDL